MKLPRRQFLHLVAGAAALPAVSRMAMTQPYPSRPITIVVPYAAGGATDLIARVLGDRMGRALGQPVSVENVVGSGGSIGLRRVARASPDGYTVVVGNWGTHVALGVTHELDYDLFGDFEPIAQLPGPPVLIVTKKAVPANNLKELIAWLKTNQDKVSVGTSGVGGTSHVAGVFLQNAIGARFQYVPHRGAGRAIDDSVAGHTDLMVDASPNVLPHLRAGTIKAYAVMTTSRLAAAPDVPTVDEAGMPGLYLSILVGLWAPKGTPKDVIGRLNAAVVDVMDNPAARARLADLGIQFPPREKETPEALAAFQKAEIEKWSPIIKKFGIKAQ
ncbi:MAG TPA: tripartite tricarboxylate transporter substrate-binding protein [Xanthobacteraceae bacterium]|nr:tripartite tricarboxylate transporter substrate-binding protein [Xanthobacteraceae bacterium]